MPVPSPGEKGGGFGVGLATPPCKTTIATETANSTHNENYTCGEGGQTLMTVLDQSQLEVQYPIHGKPFNARKPTLIGTWNVRTLNQCGKLAQLLREFDSYRLDILGICEMRWTSSGKIINDGKTIIYSGHDKEHIGGVGIIMSKIAASALIAWKPISDRIITARLQTKQIKVTTIQAYAPTEDAEDTIKDQFYNQLQTTLDETPTHDLILLMGDFNAKINPNRTGFEYVMGPYGSAENISDNGERLISLCASNSLSIGNTYFKHKQIHKKTWRSPNGETFNEIDYICISKRWRSSLLDVRTRRGADIGSDHYLVSGKCKLRLKRQPKRATRPRPFNVEKLKDGNTAAQFQLKLTNRN
ncbi:craniofacial development protein 2-like [Biomphalaria glabrata]|uniref:Craniofacial development protein 2-like n=1 Tax=Biomphalaria glabrata TaxID=6526 RepID=A0A9W2YV61_BIOGL|nr:craniofacial development protein 2-like [Biomphalaria glabrata]XP_055866668.1 craniofacial development protein 2-like [Biomphalaria glabrata]